MYFPREVPVLGAILAAVVDFLIALVLFFIVGPIIGAEVSAWWLFAPVLAIPLALLAAGVSIVFGALNVYYRDFRYALPFLLQLWLFASPVAYPLSVVPDRGGGSTWYSIPPQVSSMRSAGRSPSVRRPTLALGDRGRRNDRRVVRRLPGVQGARTELRGRDLTCRMRFDWKR